MITVILVGYRYLKGFFMFSEILLTESQKQMLKEILGTIWFDEKIRLTYIQYLDIPVCIYFNNFYKTFFRKSLYYKSKQKWNLNFRAIKNSLTTSIFLLPVV